MYGSLLSYHDKICWNLFTRKVAQQDTVSYKHHTAFRNLSRNDLGVLSDSPFDIVVGSFDKKSVVYGFSVRL